MASAELKAKIRSALRDGRFGDEDDLVDVSEGDDGSIHVIVVSRKLDNKRFRDKRDLVWDDLMSKLTRKEWAQVSVAIAMSPDEIKAR